MLNVLLFIALLRKHYHKGLTKVQKKLYRHDTDDAFHPLCPLHHHRLLAVRADTVRKTFTSQEPLDVMTQRFKLTLNLMHTVID